MVEALRSAAWNGVARNACSPTQAAHPLSTTAAPFNATTKKCPPGFVGMNQDEWSAECMKLKVGGEAGWAVHPQGEGMAETLQVMHHAHAPRRRQCHPAAALAELDTCSGRKTEAAGRPPLAPPPLLQPGMAQAAAFLETRRYAAYKGATTEFQKWVTFF